MIQRAPASPHRSAPKPFQGGPSRKTGLARWTQDSQRMRALVQGAFALICIWIGVDFALFLRWGASGGQTAYVPHPAGAEGFLPISALMSVRHWLITGRIHPVHPAGLFILLAALAIALLLKKAFCSWICPVGTLSEGLWRLGRRLFGRNLDLPRWADLPLRGLKYLLLGLFLWAVWGMEVPMLEAFLNGTYNAVADIRMYLFFAHLAGLGLAIILFLVLFSLVVENPWCRYLCPYGALLGLTSLASPLKIKRSSSTCIDCKLCTKACPARIQVHALNTVQSDECSACYRCVAVCPVQGTLQMRAPGGRAVPGWVFGLLVVGLFVAVTGMAMATGHWRTSVSREDYLRLIPLAPTVQHP